MNALEKKLAKIVRGQVHSYMNDHPDMFSAKAKAQRGRNNVTNGIAKRAVPDILTVLIPGCSQNGAEVACNDDGTASPEQDPAGVGTTAPAGRLFITGSASDFALIKGFAIGFAIGMAGLTVGPIIAALLS